MATSYAVTFDATCPEKFERPQVFVRIVVYIVLSAVTSAAYLGLPVIAAIWISQKGSERFIAEDGPRIRGWLRWIVALYAYLYMLTDRFPSSTAEEDIRFDLQPAGAPTVGSALMRLIYSIPSALVAGALLWVAAAIWLIASVMVLVQETYPEGLYDFQRGAVRWQARLLAYHASLVDAYPPFAFDMGPEPAAVD